MKKLKDCLLSAGLLVLVLLAATSSSLAQVTPSADAYTNSASAGTNFGAAVTLGVANTATSNQKTYVQFDLSSIPAGFNGSNIAKASLKLYVNSVTTAGSFNVDYVTGPWVEKTITANLSPSLGTTVAGNVPLTTALVHDYVLVDVTPAVVAWLNGTQANDGLALVANSPLNATFDSKENTTQSHSPELDVVFSGGGTITGITTAAGSGLTGGTSSGVANLSLLTSCSAGQILSWNGTAWACKSVSGSGTVTSVGLNVPSSDFTLTGSPITTAGTFALGWTVPPTSVAAANAIVKRDSVGGFNAGPIQGLSFSTNPGVFGAVNTSNVVGAIGVYGHDPGKTSGGHTIGVLGDTGNSVGIGVFGTNGVLSNLGTGFLNHVTPGVWGDSGHTGVLGTTDSGIGVEGYSDSGIGVLAAANSGASGSGLEATHSGEGNAIYAYNAPATGATAYNATLLLEGLSGTSHFVLYAQDGSGANYVRTDSTGNLLATSAIYGASKNFKIDHPVDPTNKYLVHTSIESPDMMNIYNGITVLDGNGGATVELPSYFEALNKDFRYQLTSIGAPGPNLYVSQKVKNNRFEIAGGQPGAEVSWQVTGIRHDAWANANRSPVEVEKTEAEQGRYLHPEAFGLPVEKSITYNGGAARRKMLDIEHKLPQKNPLGSAQP